MIARLLFLATALLASSLTAAAAQTRDNVVAAPVLRAEVQVPPPPEELTVQVNEAVPVAPVLSVTVTVVLYVPAVVGVPDQARGQIAKAFIVLRRHEDASDDLSQAIQEFVKKSIAPYKYPRAIEFVTALPKILSAARVAA